MDTALAPAPARRRARWPRRLAVLVVVLLVLAVLVDRAGDVVAERIAGDNLQSSQHLTSRPDVSIDGFPFLTQLASGNYGHVTVDADSLPIAGGVVTLSHLHVDLDRVQIRDHFSHFHVDSASAQGTIDYAELSRRLGVTVRYAGNNRIQASTSISMMGHTVTPTVTVHPALVNGALSFTQTTINGADGTLGSMVETLDHLFDAGKLPLQGIPFEVKVTGLDVDAQGLELDLAGANLTYVTN